MANYFNVNRVEYLPNTGIIENAGALGKAVETAFLNKYKQDLTNKQNAITNQHNADTLEETKSNNLFNRIIKENQLSFDYDKFLADVQNKEAIQQLNQDKYELDVNQNSALGAEYVRKYPKDAEKIINALGLTPQNGEPLSKEAYAYLGKLIKNDSGGSNYQTSAERNFKLYQELISQGRIEDASILAAFSGSNPMYLNSFSSIDNISSGIGIDPDDIKNGNFDFSKLPPKTQVKIRQAADIMLKNNPKAISSKNADKLIELSQAGRQAVELANYSKKNIDDLEITGLFDNAWGIVNKYIQFKDDDRLIAAAGTASNYAAFRNTIIKAMSGQQVTENELTRFKEAFGTLWQNDKAAVIALFQRIKDTQTQVQAIKNASNPLVFETYYGNVLRDFNYAANTIEEAIKYYTNGGVNENDFVTGGDVTSKASTVNNDTKTKTLADGTVLIQYPNGSGRAIYPDGRIEEIK